MNTSDITVPATASQNEPSSNSNVDARLILTGHIENGSKSMLKGAPYTLGQIFNLTVEGRLYWSLAPSPTSVGSVVAGMVGKHLLPLKSAGKASDNALLYILL